MEIGPPSATVRSPGQSLCVIAAPLPPSLSMASQASGRSAVARALAVSISARPRSRAARGKYCQVTV